MLYVDLAFMFAAWLFIIAAKVFPIRKTLFHVGAITLGAVYGLKGFVGRLLAPERSNSATDYLIMLFFVLLSAFCISMLLVVAKSRSKVRPKGPGAYS